MPTLAEIQSRQHNTAQDESRMLALGQESFRAARFGETYVTATGGTEARTLADWMAIVEELAGPALLRRFPPR